MEEVVLSCLKCGAEVGRFNNSWDGIGNTYYSPIHPPVSFFNGFVPAGDVHRGTDKTRVRDCFLQDLSCRNCGTILGVRCDSAPEGHLLKKNQLILGLKLMHMVSERTRATVAPSVHQRFSLTLPGAPKLSIDRRASTVQPTPHTQTPSSSARGNMARTMNGPVLPLIESNKPKSMIEKLQPSPTTDSTQRDLSKFVSWAEGAIKSQRNDIDRIGGAVDRIERDMKSFKDFMLKTQTEAAVSRQGEQDLNPEDLVRLQTTVFQLKQESQEVQQQLVDNDVNLIRKEQNDLRRENQQFQQRLEKEDLALIQRDISKLKQESRNFRQDLEKTDLTNIRELDQLRRGVDSNKERLAEFLENDRLLVSTEKMKGFTDDVNEIHRKVNELDGLKIELQKLQDHIRIMEMARQSLVSPEADVNISQAPARSSWEKARMRSGMTEPSRQQTQVGSDAPGVLDAGTAAERRTPSQGQPQKHTEFASVVRSKVPGQGSRAKSLEEDDPRSHIPTSGHGIAVGPASPPHISKWVYTGSSHRNRLRTVFRDFGIPYRDLAAVDHVQILEDHVNNSQIQNSVTAKRYGQVIIRLDSNKRIEIQESLEPEPPLPKRKRDQVEDEDTDRQPRFDFPSKKTKVLDPQPSRATDTRFRSSNLRSHSSLRDSHAIIRSNLGSPELSGDSMIFQSYPDNEDATNDKPSYISPKSSTTSKIQKPVADSKRDSLPKSVPNTAQPTSPLRPWLNPARGSERRNGATYKSRKPTEIPTTPAGKVGSRSLRSQGTALKQENAVPTSTSRRTFHGAILPSIETEAAATRAADAQRLAREEDETDDLDELAGQTPQQPGDEPTSTSIQFRCGGCGTLYKSMPGLNRHRKSNTCNQVVGNKIPAKFKCASCGKSFTDRHRLDYHYTQSAACQDPDTARKKTLAARELMVRETLEREMGP